MFHAINAGKARLEKIFDGATRQPREDLITSSLFGTITFLTSVDRGLALKALTNTVLPGETEIVLWPYLMASGKKSAEPDVVLKYQGEQVTQYWIVEVKWGAKLSEHQIRQGISLVKEGECRQGRQGSLPNGPRNVAGYTLLGKERQHMDELENARKAPESSSNGLEITDLTWPDLTKNLRYLKREHINRPGLMAWTDVAEAFLSGTSRGTVLREWPKNMVIPKPFQFSFSEWPRNLVIPKSASFSFD